MKPMETKADIRAFRAQIVEGIREKDRELALLKESLMAVDKVLEMMSRASATAFARADNGQGPDRLYARMGAKEAVKRLLMDYPEKDWGVKDIRDTLLQNGFKPTTKHLYSLLSATLDRLADDSFVNLERTDKGKRYRKITGSVIQTTLSP